MSIVHVNQIAKKLQTLFEGKIDVSGNNNDPEITFLTRSLAAYAIQISAQIDEIEAANSITDGFDDNGIDAIYFSQTNRTLYLANPNGFKMAMGSRQQEMLINLLLVLKI